jgi:hypothetical protein
MKIQELPNICLDIRKAFIGDDIPRHTDMKHPALKVLQAEQIRDSHTAGQALQLNQQLLLLLADVH